MSKKKRSIRINRDGERMIASTLYVKEDADDAYAKASEQSVPKRSKSWLMTNTLIKHAPK